MQQDNFNNFHYVAILLDLVFGVEINDEDLEELGLLAWELIGNKNYKFYKYCATINCPDLSITLPCNAALVESVTALYEDWSSTTNYSEYGDEKTAYVENRIEAEKLFNSEFYSSGKFIPYTQNKDVLYFTHNYGTVNILYKGIFMDEDGLPELTDKEALAIATYIAWILKYKEGLKTNNRELLAIALTLNDLWRNRCDLARITYLNQNDMNNILNVAHSWNRHSYGFSYKPIV